MSDRLLTYREVAQYLGVSPRTVRRYVTEGRLQAHRVGPRARRVSAAALRRFVETPPEPSRVDREFNAILDRMR